MGDVANVRRGCRMAFRTARVLPLRAHGASRDAIVLCNLSGEARGVMAKRWS